MTFSFVPEAIIVVLSSVPVGIGAALAARRLSGTEHPSFLGMTAAAMAVSVWALVAIPGASFLLVASCALGWILLLLAIVDALAFRLPDILTLPLIVAGLVVSWWLPERDTVGHAVAALLGVAFFYAIAFVYRQARGQDGLGMGDVKLAGAAGAWLGWQALPFVILIACATGFLWVGVAMIRRGKAALNERIPFGVALCLAIWIVWLYGSPNFSGLLS